uniref:40S ribosomal protein SA C-terminal domain-containing protein n=1 Tax=Capra hircus TaxID=9925 RepID=A0A8C2NAS4_CAPHI
ISALDVLQMKEEDVLKFLTAGNHLGGTNLDFQMEQYIYKRKSDGIYIVNLKRTWEKLLLVARVIVAIENPADVSVISSRNTGQRVPIQQFPTEAWSAPPSTEDWSAAPKAQATEWVGTTTEWS